MAVGCEGVLHFRWNLMVYLRDNAVAFQLPQLLREHLLGGVGQRFSQFTKPPCAFEQIVNGDHDLIIYGNDASAKGDATKLLGEWFGWKKENIIDLGDITAARGTEMYLALWLRLWGVLGTPHFNIKVLRGS